MGRRGRRRRDDADDADDSLEVDYCQRNHRTQDGKVDVSNPGAGSKVFNPKRDDGGRTAATCRNFKDSTAISDLTRAKGLPRAEYVDDKKKSKSMMSTDDDQIRRLKKKRQQERQKRKRERREERKKGVSPDSNEHIHDESSTADVKEKQEHQQKQADVKVKSKKRRRDEVVPTKPMKNLKQGVSQTSPPHQMKKKKLQTPRQTQVVSCRKGVLYQDIVIGKGPVVQDRKKVRVSYVLRAASAGTTKQKQPQSIPGYGHGKVIDSSSSFGFRLGRGEVVVGWDVGVQGMRQGGRRYLLVPPQAGYGSKDIGGGVGAVLFFDISVL